MEQRQIGRRLTNQTPAVTRLPTNCFGDLAEHHCNFAYSTLACFRMGMSESASFQRVRNPDFALPGRVYFWLRR